MEVSHNFVADLIGFNANEVLKKKTRGSCSCHYRTLSHILSVSLGSMLLPHSERKLYLDKIQRHKLNPNCTLGSKIALGDFFILM